SSPCCLPGREPVKDSKNFRESSPPYLRPAIPSPTSDEGYPGNKARLMSYSTRLLQVAAIAVIGVVAMGLVLVTNAWAEENIPPVAVDDAAATVQDQPVDIDVLSNDSDPDGGTLSV